ncbi:transmembrane channel-like protein 5 isoform 1-T2 [Discoglossus pictus]
MSLLYNEGFANSGYHDSETLELDRGAHTRPSSRQKSSFHQNLFYDEDAGYGDGGRGRSGDQIIPPMDTMQLEYDYNHQAPRYSASRNDPYRGGYVNSTFQPESVPPYLDHNQGRPFYIDNDDSQSERGGSVRRRGSARNNLHLDILRPPGGTTLDEESEHRYKQANKDFVEKLSEMSDVDIIREIQKLPTNLKEKQEIRHNVIKIKQKTSKHVSQRNCCEGCMHSMRLSFRRFKQFTSDTFDAIRLWHQTLKVIGGRFGTSILSYFIFLKWLLTFNIFSFIVNFSFITVPQFVDLEPNNLSFSGLELLTGAGYFDRTVLYYGYYTNETIQKNASLAPYNMQLAYIFTIGLYLAACFIILVYSMASSFRKNFINPASISGNAAKILCSWDFSITNEKVVRLKQKSLSTQIKETLFDKLQEKLKLTLSQKTARFFIHVTAWVLSTGMAVGCCAGVYYLCIRVQDAQYSDTSDLTKQAATLLVAVVVGIINLIMPLVYAMFGLVEKFKYPRHEIYVVILRNVLLKISIIGILCYYWLHSVAESGQECWESYVGQDIYRLVVIDFIFALIGSFFGEFVRRIIGTQCCKQLGKPEFDIARNVLDLIYAQTLAWIGIFFSPLLPIIQIIKLFIIFYVKKVSLMMNCTPPRRAWRASQMTTAFIFLLFFPSFAGVLCMVGVTIWRRQPSTQCGPFRHLDAPYMSISNWISSIKVHENLLWLVWIYQNLIESVLFFYLLTLIVLILTYLYWQIVQGRKIMVRRLLEQIANEGKDKAFLLQEMQKVQSPNGVKAQLRNVQRKFTQSRGPQDVPLGDDTPSYRSDTAGVSDALSLAMMARQQAEQEDELPVNGRHSMDGGRSSDALAMVMRARQEAEAENGQPGNGTGTSDALSMIMRARQEAETESGQPSVGTSNTLEMIMRARQQAELDGSY